MNSILCKYIWAYVLFYYLDSALGFKFGNFRSDHRHIAKINTENVGIRQCTKFLSSKKDNTFGSDRSIFIFGLGYVGLELAKSMLKDGWKVSGKLSHVPVIGCFTDKFSPDINYCFREGIDAYLFDGEVGPMIEQQASNSLIRSSFIVSTIPPMGNQNLDPVLEHHAIDLRRAALTSNLKWIGYLSSTGVYGDRSGAWVTEDDSLRPDNEKTKARVVAENSWKSLHSRGGLPVHIFRLSGIYGPHRNALESVRKTKGDVRPFGGADDQTFISRIHVTDICKVLKASMYISSEKSVSSPPSSSTGSGSNRLLDDPMIVNVADNNPATRYEVLAYCCRLLGYPVITPDSVKQSSASSSSWSSRGGSKRVDSHRMQSLLKKVGMELEYPDYRSGLKAILDDELHEHEHEESPPPPPLPPPLYNMEGSSNIPIYRRPLSSSIDISDSITTAVPKSGTLLDPRNSIDKETKWIEEEVKNEIKNTIFNEESTTSTSSNTAVAATNSPDETNNAIISSDSGSDSDRDIDIINSQFEIMKTEREKDRSQLQRLENRMKLLESALKFQNSKIIDLQDQIIRIITPKEIFLNEYSQKEKNVDSIYNTVEVGSSSNSSNNSNSNNADEVL